MTTGAALAQSQPGQNTSQDPASSQDTARESAIGAAGQARPSEGIVMNEPAGADNDNRNWGWVGLIGLTGLLGLKRHREVEDTHYRSARTNP